jgi:hypothetical protein
LGNIKKNGIMKLFHVGTEKALSRRGTSSVTQPFLQLQKKETLWPKVIKKLLDAKIQLTIFCKGTDTKKKFISHIFKLLRNCYHVPVEKGSARPILVCCDLELLVTHCINNHCINFGVVTFMGNMSESFIKSIWIPFICNLEEIQEEPSTLCVWNAAILVGIVVS